MDGETTARSLLTGKTSDFLKIGVGAAGRGDLATLQAVLAARPEWITRIGSHGRTMLWEAAYRGRLETAAHLVERGADIEARGCHFTPLLVEISPYCAARHRKHEAVAELLLARGALVDILTHAYLGDGDSVAAQLDDDPTLATAEVPQHDPNVRATVLHYAVAAGHLDIVRMLLARGAKPAPYAVWLTRFAIWRERADILRELIGAGMPVEPHAVPRAGVLSGGVRSALAAAGVADDPDRAEGGWPPIVFQSRGDRGGSVERVRELIERGADVNVTNHKGQTALHCAAKAGFVDIVELLLARGATVDAVDATGETPLATALRSTAKDKERLLAAVRCLLAAGADRHHADKQGRTPANIASRKRDDRWAVALEIG